MDTGCIPSVFGSRAGRIPDARIFHREDGGRRPGARRDQDLSSAAVRKACLRVGDELADEARRAVLMSSVKSSTSVRSRTPSRSQDRRGRGRRAGSQEEKSMRTGPGTGRASWTRAMERMLLAS
jgi:hypothetical protein